jgi:hypothetical protein
MTVSREAIATALANLIQGAYQWNQPVSRRLVLWNKVDPSLRPAAFLVEHTEKHTWQSTTYPLRKRELQYRLYIYISSQPADDTTTTGGTQFNTIFDALEAAIAPSGADIVSGRNTLGGLVTHAFISGQVICDPGDLDGDGVAIIPFSVLVP